MMLGGGGKNAEFALPIAWKGKRRRAERASKDLSREAMQNMSVNCSNASDRGKQAKILGYI